ncbi:hypothetical protein ACKWTF_001325 [Chironomus riparius]
MHQRPHQLEYPFLLPLSYLLHNFSSFIPFPFYLLFHFPFVTNNVKEMNLLGLIYKNCSTPSIQYPIREHFNSKLFQIATLLNSNQTATTTATQKNLSKNPLFVLTDTMIYMRIIVANFLSMH